MGMGYRELLEEYIDDCEVALSKVDTLIARMTDDITLTTCEKFDYDFKKGLIKIRKADRNKNKGLGKYFRKDIYKPKDKAEFVAMMFYRILSTADEYDFMTATEMADTIVRKDFDKQISRQLINVDVTEDNSDNQIRYKLTVTIGNEEPLSYAIANKETYIVVMTSLLTQTFSQHPNRSIHTFLNNYLLEELAKIQENTPPTPYVEYSPKVRLCDYFEKASRGIPGKLPFNNSDFNLAATLETIRRNDMCLVNRPVKGNNTHQESVAEGTYDIQMAKFYDSTLVTPMGQGLTTTGKAPKKTSTNKASAKDGEI